MNGRTSKGGVHRNSAELGAQHLLPAADEEAPSDLRKTNGHQVSALS